MSDYNLGTAHGEVRIDFDGGGLDQADRRLQEVRETANETSGDFGRVGTAMAGAGVVIAGGLAVAVNSAANFEQRLSAIQAVSGSTAGQMDLIRDAALRIGKDTSFSATEAAQAMEELSKAGISTEDILGGVADATVALAAAGEIDLPNAAMISSNALNQFNLTAADMGTVVDYIAGAANASAIDVADFGQSMSQVGAVANLAGLSFQDTAVAIAEMGNAGIKGSDAGTSLKTMLANLQPSTLAASNAMAELGIITEDGSNQFYTAEGSVKSLRDIQEVLQGATEDLTDAQKQQYLQTIFGSDAIRAAAVLAGEGAEGFDALNASMTSTSAAEVAKTRLDNMKGSLEAMKGSLETVAIQIGTLLIPAIRSIIDSVSGAIDWFLALDPAVMAAVTGFAAAAATFLLVAGGLIKLAAIVTSARTAIAALNVAMAANPALFIIGGLLALGAAMVVLYNTWEPFRNLVQTVWGAIQTAIGAVVDWFTGTVVPAFVNQYNIIRSGIQPFLDWFSGSVMPIIRDVWDAILTAAQAVADWFSGSGLSAATTALDVLGATGQWLWDLMVAVWGGIRDAAIGAINLIGPALTALTGFYQDHQTTINVIASIIAGFFIPTLVSLVVQLVATAISAVASFATMVASAVAAGIAMVASAAETIAIWALMKTSAIANAARIVAAFIMQNAAAWASAAAAVASGTTSIAIWALYAGQAIANAARVAFGWAMTAAGAVAGAASAVAAGAVVVGGWILMGAQSLLNAARVAAAWFIALGPIGWAIAAIAAVVALVIIYWDEIVSAFRAAGAWIAGIMTLIGNGIAAAWAWVVNAFNSATAAIGAAVQAAWNWVVNTWNTIMSFLGGIPGMILGVFAAAGSWLLNAGRNVLTGLYNGITGMWSTVSSWFSGIGSTITGLLSGAASWLYNAGRNVIQGFWNGLKGIVGSVWDWISDWAGGLVDDVMSILGINSPSVIFHAIGEYLMMGLQNGIEAEAEGAIGAAADAASGIIDAMTMPAAVVQATAAGAGISEALLTTASGSGASPYAGSSPGASWSPAIDTSGGTVPQNIINTTVNAPQTMSPEQVAAATAARVGFALSGSVTPVPSTAAASIGS